MTTTHRTVVDSQGKPAAALIPWAEFLLIQELLEGDEGTDEEAAALREADRRAGNRDAFTNLASLKPNSSSDMRRIVLHRRAVK